MCRSALVDNLMLVLMGDSVPQGAEDRLGNCASHFDHLLFYANWRKDNLQLS